MARETLRAHRARIAFAWIAWCMCLWFCGASKAAEDVNSPAADGKPADAQATDAPEADAATKKLMAAHGLFQRGLFNLAAQKYADFLSD